MSSPVFVRDKTKITNRNEKTDESLLIKPDSPGWTGGECMDKDVRNSI